MTVIAPPELPQRHGELEALIEEARRRARRRRLKYAAPGAAAPLLAGGVYAGLELTGTFSATGPRVPEGFSWFRPRDRSHMQFCACSPVV